MAEAWAAKAKDRIDNRKKRKKAKETEPTNA